MAPILERLIAYLICAAARGWSRIRNSARRSLAAEAPTAAATDAAASNLDEFILGEILPWAGKSELSQISAEPHGRSEEIAPIAAQSAAQQFFRTPTWLFFLHCLVTGAVGSGKTVFLLRILYHLMGRIIREGRGVIFVIDPFGDLYQRIVRFLAGPAAPTGLRTILFNLRDTSRIVGLNLLAGPGTPFSRASRLVDVVSEWHADGLGVTVVPILRNSLVALIEAGEPITSLELFWRDPTFCAQVLSKVTDAHVLAYFATLDQEDRKGATKAAGENKISPLLANADFALRFSDPAPLFDIDAILKSEFPTVVVMSLAADALPGRAGFLLGSCVLAQLEQSVLSRVTVPEQARVPVYALCEEFSAMASFSAGFDQLLLQGRRLKCGFVFFAQNLAVIPAAFRSKVRANAGIKLAFATGNVDAAELAADAIADAPNEVVRQTIVRQPVGCAVASVRGRLSVHIRVPFENEELANDETAADSRPTCWRAGRSRASF